MTTGKIDEHQVYADYLKSRSLKALVYRNLILYPKLSQYLNGKSLDLGCGIGDYLRFNRKSIGVDINEHLVEFCRSKGLTASVIKEDNLDFDSGYFDSVLLDNVIEHIANPRKLISEIHRVLKSDGILVVGVPGFRGYDRDEDHKKFYDERILLETFREYFSHIKFFYSPIFKSDILSRNLSSYCIYSVFRNKG